MRLRIRLMVLCAALAAGFLMGTVAPASAQTTSLEGFVTMKGADGKSTPVADVTVEIYQTDKKGKLPVLKTDKKGRYFTFGAAVAGLYTIIVHGPGIEPTYLTGVRPAIKNNNDILVNPGDGRSLSLEATMGAGTGSGAPLRSAADVKAAEAEAATRAAEAAAARAKEEELVANYTQRTKLFDAGMTLQKNKDLAGAIPSFQKAMEGLDPTNVEYLEIYAKSAGQIADAHYQLGIDAYNAALKATDEEVKKAGKATAKTHLTQAATAINMVVQSMNVPNQKAIVGLSQATYYALQGEISLKLAQLFSDKTRADAGAKAFIKAGEIDSAKKVAYTVNAGEVYRRSGKVNEAIATFKSVLATEPDNLTAIYGIGLAAFASEDTSDYQIAADYLKLFVEKGGSDPRVEDAKKTLDVLKTGFKITPKKIS